MRNTQTDKEVSPESETYSRVMERVGKRMLVSINDVEDELGYELDTADVVVLLGEVCLNAAHRISHSIEDKSRDEVIEILIKSLKMQAEDVKKHEGQSYQDGNRS